MFGCIEAKGEEREEKRAKEGKWGKNGKENTSLCVFECKEEEKGKKEVKKLS